MVKKRSYGKSKYNSKIKFNSPTSRVTSTDFLKLENAVKMHLNGDCCYVGGGIVTIFFEYDNKHKFYNGKIKEMYKALFSNYKKWVKWRLDEGLV